MPRDPVKADAYKAEGNKFFQRKDYAVAESLYSKAIIANDTSPMLYTNRAMARIKLAFYESAISDCRACLELSSNSMKAYFILSQCLLPLKDYDGALDNALRAHRICAETNDRSLASVTSQVRQCKKERWEDREKRRMRENQELEHELTTLLHQHCRDEVDACYVDLERQGIDQDYKEKLEVLKTVFERARSTSEKTREVPDWAIDDISFEIMVDPVMTKTGKSYERASIMEHLRRHPTDPLTREPLLAHELRPNLGLRQACEEFLDNNGWAANW